MDFSIYTIDVYDGILFIVAFVLSGYLFGSVLGFFRYLFFVFLKGGEKV